MKSHSLTKRFLTVGLVLGTFVFFFALAFPHFHDESNVTDQEHSCLVCKIQKSFSSTDAVKPVVSIKPKFVSSFYLERVEVQKFTLLFNSKLSRAPPAVH